MRVSFPASWKTRANSILKFITSFIYCEIEEQRVFGCVELVPQEEHPRNGSPKDVYPPGIGEEFITRVAEEIDGSVAQKIFQDYCRTESRILGVLSSLGEFLLKSHFVVQCGNIPGTSRDFRRNQELDEDRSQNDTNPEADDTENGTPHTAVPETIAVLYKYKTHLKWNLVQRRQLVSVWSSSTWVFLRLWKLLVFPMLLNWKLTFWC